MPGRSRHWTDEALVRVPGTPQRYTRTIRNWANVPTVDGGWEEAGDGILRASQGKPPHWDGAFEFSHGVEQRAAQVWIRQRPRPLIGMRLSHRPDVWCNWRTVGQPVRDAVVDDVGATWPDAWPGCDLRVELRAAGFEDLITLRERESARSFAWSLRLSPGLTVRLEAGAIVFVHETLGEVWRTRPAVAWDASPGPLGRGHPVDVACSLDLSGPLPIVSYVVTPDLDRHIWPITVDPTTTISGTSAIEDVVLVLEANPYPNRNYGSTPFVSISGTNRAGLVRLLSFPSTNISSCVFWMYGQEAQTATAINAYTVAAANTWVEGTVSDTIQNGSCCWNYAKYNTQAWAGSAGCQTSGIDYDASPIGTIPFMQLSSWNQMTLTASTIAAWAAGSRVNNGFFMRAPLGNISRQGFFATENASNQPYFVLDYTTAPPSRLPLLLKRRS